MQIQHLWPSIDINKKVSVRAFNIRQFSWLFFVVFSCNFFFIVLFGHLLCVLAEALAQIFVLFCKLWPRTAARTASATAMMFMASHFGHWTPFYAISFVASKSLWPESSKCCAMIYCLRQVYKLNLMKQQVKLLPSTFDFFHWLCAWLCGCVCVWYLI